MSYLALILINVFFWGISYFFFRPYLSRFGKHTIYHGFIILASLSFMSYELVRFFMKEPDFFEAGIEQLRTVKYVDDKVGDFQSYTYDPRLFKQNDNQAIFDVELKGNDNLLFLTCVMKQIKNDWILTEVKSNKLVKDLDQEISK